MNIAALLPKPETLRALRSRIEPHGIVLAYHRIAHAAYDPWNLCVSPENFAQHLEVLRRHADIVPLRAMRAAIGNRSSRRLPVAITFDDGYADNALQARPILERYHAPATFFICSGFIAAGKEFWSDRLARLVLSATMLPEPLTILIAGQECSFSRAALGRRGVLEALWRRLRPLRGEEQDEILRQLQQLLCIDLRTNTGQLPMTAEQVRSLARSGVFEIGAHTRTHCQLTSRSPAEQMAEIAGSKRDCEAIAGVSVTSFAYPYGWYDGISVECARSAGYELACTTVPQAVTRRCDPYRLPRLTAPDLGGEAFARSIALSFSSLRSRISLAA